MTAPRNSDELLEHVRATAEGFAVYGELGRRTDRDIWYLARDDEAAKLVALRLRQDGVDDQGQPAYSLEIANELDKDVPLGEGECPHCGAKLRSFARFCGKCGGDLTSSSQMPKSAEERAALLEEVRLASADVYDVVGEMPWGGGAGLVYFALEKATGRLVRLRLKLEGDDYSLGETQAAMALKTKVLAAYTSGVGPAVPRPTPAAPAAARDSPAPPRSAPRQAGGARKLVIGAVVVALVAVIAYFAFAG